MSETKIGGDREATHWRLLERLALAFAVVASLATVVGLVLQVRSENRSAEVRVVSADHLTELPSVSGLEGDFTFKGVRVTGLWRLRLVLANAGNTSLVGQGSNSMLLEDDIEISFPTSSTVLDVSPAIGAFYTITQTADNCLALRFSQ